MGGTKGSRSDSYGLVVTWVSEDKKEVKVRQCTVLPEKVPDDWLNTGQTLYLNKYYMWVRKKRMVMDMIGFNYYLGTHYDYYDPHF